jgi:branched-chain amino acid transport system ATP-binding protein
MSELSVKELSAWHGRAQVLFDVQFEVNRGQCLALVGRNGAGKSSVLKALMNLNLRRSGQIVFRAKSIDHLSTYQIAQAGIGFVPEDRRIFTDLTVSENLQVGRQSARPGAHHWTAQQIYQLFPNLEPMQNRSAAQMSGGEQQMLTVARTLMGNPHLVLLDEPSEGVAPLIVAQMAKTIAQIKRQGLTIILSEQNIHFAAQVADTAVVLEKGAVVITCTLQELMDDSALRQKYLGV